MNALNLKNKVLISSIYTNQLEKEKKIHWNKMGKRYEHMELKGNICGFKHIRKLSISLLMRQKYKLELYKDYIFMCKIGKDEKMITQSQHCW